MNKPPPNNIRDALHNAQMIFVVEDLKLKNNGIVESVMRKIKFIQDAWGIEPILLTAAHNISLSLLEIHFGEEQTEGQTRFNEGTRVFSVFDYFQNSYPYRKGYDIQKRPK